MKTPTKATLASTLLAAFAAAQVALCAPSPQFMPTGSMNDTRVQHAISLLANGSALVIGGENSTAHLDTAERYDPVSGTFSYVGPMSTPRYGPGAITLLDGRVLVAGGHAGGDHLASAEIFDPTLGVFVPTGSMSAGRSFFAATRLADGRVLVSGGHVLTTPTFSTATAEVYDPSTGTWSLVGNMTVPRLAPELGLLADGRVLVAGGSGGAPAWDALASAEIFDPVTATFSAVNSMATPRTSFSAVVLPTGKVLVCGGGFGFYSAAGTAEVFDPATGQWSLAGNMNKPRIGHNATLLSDGKVLVTGGRLSAAVVATANAEIYDPSTGIFLDIGEMHDARWQHKSMLLPDGRVLIVGGVVSDEAGVHSTAHAELFVPAPTPPPCASPNGTWTTQAPVPIGSKSFGATEAAGKLYTVGGAGTRFTCNYLRSNQAYDPVANSWSAKAPMPTARESLGVVTINGIIYAVGGGTGCGVFTAVLEAYDPVSDSWTTKAPTPAPRSGPAVGAANGILYVAGGWNNGHFTTLFAYDPATDTWSTKAPMPSQRGAHVGGVVNGIFYVVGGYDPSIGAVDGKVLAYDVVTDTWTTKASMLTPRSYHTISVVNGILYAIGGYNGIGYVATVEAYDPVTDTWTAVTPMPTARAGAASAAVNGVIYVVAGEDSVVSPFRVNEAFTPCAIAQPVNNPPVVICKNVTVTAAANCSAVASVNDGSFDPDGDAITITQSPAGPYPLGATSVTLTVTDSHGVSSSCGATVTVVDSTAPAIACPQNISIGCSTDKLVPVSFSVTASDSCDSSPSVNCSPASGSGFPVGTTTVNCVATDASGNQSQCSFTVTRAALGFSGFAAPIGSADGSGGSFANPLRTFKMGSTIPVKYTASCEGSPVLTGANTLQAIKYSDATTSDTPIDATPQNSATSGNQFRLTDAQWQFNLDTKATGMRVGIWQLLVTLSDGSRHRVWIQLK